MKETRIKRRKNKEKEQELWKIYMNGKYKKKQFLKPIRQNSFYDSQLNKEESDEKIEDKSENQSQKKEDESEEEDQEEMGVEVQNEDIFQLELRNRFKYIVNQTNECCFRIRYQIIQQQQKVQYVVEKTSYFPSKYLIKQNDQIIGKVIRNLIGNKFTVSQNGQPKAQIWDTNFMSIFNPRQFELHLKQPNNEFKRQYCSRKSRWSEEQNCHVMNYRNQARHLSVRNFILESIETKQEVILFVKQSENENKFKLQIKQPLTPFLGIACALTQLDFSDIFQ